LDLAYNLRPAGLMKRESLIAAARKADWEAAATLAHHLSVRLCESAPERPV
jgi:hypothetical protein